LRVVIVLLLIGFPLALLLAWAFDVTSSGIQSTPKTPVATGGEIRGIHRRRNVFFLVSFGVAVAIAAGFFVLPRVSATKIEKSIAVLPFENYSDDKDNAYFADGIQDDILTNLARISDLKVISRTSVMAYRGGKHNVREIGKALGASAILEGSVRKDKDRVRVTVQLINAETDQHIWANEYDRNLTDMFAIQSDLAQNIAKELQAKLSPAEKEQLTRKPTENGEAYLAFVQARNLYLPEDYEKLAQSEQLYERALQLDPNFALAAAEFSHVKSWIYHSFEPTPKYKNGARELAERALRIQPDLPEGHLALGFVSYYCDQDFEAAEKEFGIAQKGLPNESEVYLALGAIERRQGRWEESTANLKKSVELNPKATWPLQNLAFNYEMLRDYKSAIATVDRALQLEPGNFVLAGLKARFDLASTGDLTSAQKIAELFKRLAPSQLKSQEVIAAKVQFFLLQRKWPEALAAAEEVPDHELMDKTGALCEKNLFIGIANYFLGNTEAARVALTRAKDLAEAQIRESPTTWAGHVDRGYALAYLGDKTGAAAEAEKAMQILPVTKDAFNGPDVIEHAAKIFAAIGDKDRAIDLISGLLQRPAALTIPLLKVGPEWDSLRDDPRFQQLLTKESA
jgi:TolB-like protein/Flp pilus assembly protein TadD